MNISVHIILLHDNHFSVFLCLCRYADPGEPAAGHSAHAGKCASALFLCLLHFWHHWRAAVGWTIKKSLLPRGELHPVSTKRGGLVGLREWEREKTEWTECFNCDLIEEKSTVSKLWVYLDDSLGLPRIKRLNLGGRIFWKMHFRVPDQSIIGLDLYFKCPFSRRRDTWCDQWIFWDHMDVGDNKQFSSI